MGTDQQQTDQQTDSPRLAELIREGLRRKGWTQQKLAEASGLSEGTISNYLSGRRGKAARRDTADRLRSIAEALDLPVRDIWDAAGIADSTPDEIEVIHLYRTLSPEDQQAAIRMMRGLTDQ